MTNIIHEWQLMQRIAMVPLTRWKKVKSDKKGVYSTRIQGGSIGVTLIPDYKKPEELYQVDVRVWAPVLINDENTGNLKQTIQHFGTFSYSTDSGTNTGYPGYREYVFELYRKLDSRSKGIDDLV